jgi:hypothetical protein
MEVDLYKNSLGRLDLHRYFHLHVLLVGNYQVFTMELIDGNKL